MQSVPLDKADGVLSPHIQTESAQHSPDCVSIGVISQTGASSSGCPSLLCTEDSLDDCALEDGCAWGDEVHELCISYRSDAGRRLNLANIHHLADSSFLKDAIRDDFCKQYGIRPNDTAVGRCVDDCGSSSSKRGGGVKLGGAHYHLPGAYRARMVVWMREVAEALGLHWATLFTATSVLDRFTATTEALPPSNLLQLLALACMSVAVKYEEVQQLSPGVWLSLAVDESGRQLYGPCDLQRCEFSLLQTIDWQLHEPNTYTFLEHFLAISCPRTTPTSATVGAADPSDGATTSMLSKAISLAEVSRQFSTFLSYQHSTVALACLTLAERMAYGDASSMACRDYGAFSPSAAATAAATAATGAVMAADISGAVGITSSEAIMSSTTTTASRAAASVANVSGMPLAYLAPKLSACTEALERCYELLTTVAPPQRREA